MQLVLLDHKICLVLPENVNIIGPFQVVTIARIHGGYIVDSYTLVQIQHINIQYSNIWFFRKVSCVPTEI